MPCVETNSLSTQKCVEKTDYSPQNSTPLQKIGMTKYIYQRKNWTDFVWAEDKIRELFGKVK